MLNDQFAVLKRDYGAININLTLAGTDRTVNSNWANNPHQVAMRKALRKGTYADINIYIVKNIGMEGAGTIIGLCGLPFPVTPGSDDFWNDGCLVHFDAVPGGRFGGWNGGRVATHEVGHWFGLLHTFEGGCDGAGDFISDTPAEAGPGSGCSNVIDSCPNQPGVDPVFNYMDYTGESVPIELPSLRIPCLG